MDNVAVYLKKIDEFIEKYKDESKISSINTYLKGNAKIIYGIPMKRFKALFSKYINEFSAINNHELFNIINSLFLSCAFEKQVAACILLEKNINKLPVNLVNLCKEYVDNNVIINWAVIDQIALYSLAQLENFSFTKEYITQDNYLLRRAVVVTFAEKELNIDECNLLIDLIKYLLDEKEEYVLRASGWAIRNIYNYNEKLYFKFLEEYSHKLPRIMLRNAIELLDEDIRMEILVTSKEKRKHI